MHETNFVFTIKSDSNYIDRDYLERLITDYVAQLVEESESKLISWHVNDVNVGE